MKLKLLPVLTLSVFTILLLSLASLPPKVFSAMATHVVISEVQVGGGTSTDEFIELYNPTNAEVDLTGWELLRKTASGEEFTSLVTLSGTVPAHGFFLVAHSDYDGSVTEDVTYSDTSLSANNTLLLEDEENVSVDKVGMGTALDFEGTGTASSPANERSIERKALPESVANDMVSGGAHNLLGNGEDSDDNDVDFVLRPAASGTEPQNTSSTAEVPTATPSPTASATPTATATPTSTPTPTQSSTPTPTVTSSPTPTPTATPSPTSTASPTPSPTMTPSPTPTPTTTPTVTPSPTPTMTASPSPTPTVTPTMTPSPTPSVTPTATPTSTPPVIRSPFRFTLECTVTYKTYGRRFFTVIIPRITCDLVPLR